MALIGSLVLLGWLAGWEVLKRVLPGLVAMNPVTAVCFILLGLALWLLGETDGAFRYGVTGRRIAQACAAMVGLVGLMKFGGYLAGGDVPIDRLLFPDRLLGPDGVTLVRMAPNTALSFLLTGLAFLFLDLRVRPDFYPAQFLGLAAGSLGLLALTGYIFGFTVFYRFTAYRPMALNTATGFVLLASGILCARPGRGLTRLFLSNNTGGIMMRRLLPAATLVPLGFGLVWRAGERNGYLSPGFALPLTAVTSIAVFTLVLYFSAGGLDKADQERGQAETALRKSAEQIQMLYNRAPCGYHSLDADGRIIAMNDTELNWLGFSREEIVGQKNIKELLTPASRERFKTVFAVLKERGEVKDVEYEFIRRDGSLLPVMLNATVARDNPDGAFSTRASVFDISARRRAEEERNRFFTLSLDLFCIAGFDGYFKTLNQSWEATLGFTIEELLAKPYLDFIHPDDRPATSNEADRNSQGQTAISFANRYRCKNGSYRWFLWNAIPVVEQGLIFAVARDITEQKRVEDSIKQLNEDLQERTVQLETLNKELEAFSYSVSHDLRAPVRHISGFVDLLAKQDLGENPKARRYLGFIADSARQMGQLVDDLLSFSRMARSEMTLDRVNLGELVAGVRSELADGCAKRDIQWHVNGLPEVNGDNAMLRLVFMNLLANAVKYTGKKPHAEIEVGSESNAEEEVIFVRDNGVGFDMQYANKLFGVFQRLHRSEDFEGTGIGLANVRRIIHRHGGRTWAEGQEGRGATFYFTLPRKSGLSTTPSTCNQTTAQS